MGVRRESYESERGGVDEGDVSSEGRERTACGRRTEVMVRYGGCCDFVGSR